MKQLHFSKELKPLMALFLQDTAQKGEAASYSRLKDMVRRCVEQKPRDNTFNARNEDRSLQGSSSLGSKHQKKEIPKANVHEKFRDRKHGDVINRPRRDNVHEEIRAASGTMSHQKGETGRNKTLPKREDTRKETEKEISKGKGTQRYQFVRRVKMTLSALIAPEGAMPEGIHM